MTSGNKEKPWQDEDVLRELYYDEQMSMQEIADHFGDLTFGGIKYWMDKHSIEKRSRSESAKVRWATEPVHFTLHQFGYERWINEINGEKHRVLHHRLLAVYKYGFEAVKGMDVHHKNGIPWDNRPDNIELLSRSEHVQLHHEESR